MITTKKMDQEFARELEGRFTIAEDESWDQDYSWVVDWVHDHCTPEEVFSEGELDTWARNNGYIKEEEYE